MIVLSRIGAPIGQGVEIQDSSIVSCIIPDNHGSLREPLTRLATPRRPIPHAGLWHKGACHLLPHSGDGTVKSYGGTSSQAFSPAC